jgi:hypothetical protein
MKKKLLLLVLGMVLVIVGALMKINKIEWSQYVLIAGLALEAFVLGSIVIQSLRKMK